MNISLDGTDVSSASLRAVSTPVPGTRYSTFLPASAPATGYGKGRYSGMSPSWKSTVSWSHEMCSWKSLSPRMLTTAVKGIRRSLPVGGMPGMLCVRARTKAC